MYSVQAAAGLCISPVLNVKKEHLFSINVSIAILILWCNALANGVEVWNFLKIRNVRHAAKT